MAYDTNPRLPKVRKETVRLVKYRGWSTRKVARHVGYSQSAVVKWCKKDPTGGWHDIPTLSSRPRSHPRTVGIEITNRIVELRFETNGRCAEVIHALLKQEGVRVSINTVRRTLDRRGLVKKRSPWKRRHVSVERPDVAKPGDLMQIDTIHLMKGRKERIYVFTLLDVHSRWVHAWASERANVRTALLFFYHARQKAPFIFGMLQSDHGTEFSQHFTERIQTLHRHSRVRCPNDNAHLERFNRTLQDECLDHLPRDVKLINKALPRYLNYYNTKRLHLGINLQTPLQVINRFQAIG